MSGKQRRGTGSITALAVAGLVLAGAAATFALGIGVLAAVMARRIVTPPTRRKDDTRVHGVDLSAGTITLQSTPDSVLPGDYSFWFSVETGHARLGEIMHSTPAAVTRRILGVDFGDLESATRGRLGGYAYLAPADLGYEFEDVLIPTDAGQAPAWFFPAAEEEANWRWVIQVHGRAVQRQETLRAVPVFREAGYSSLLVSYRNDGEAPASGDQRYGLGDTEWQDVEAAIGFARSRGATSIVLMGWSMGGAIALQAATRTGHGDVIAGVVLDSPVIDWADVVSFQGSTLRLPAPVMSGAMRVMGRRWGRRLTGQAQPIDFERLDFVARAQDLAVPILLLHSDDDGYVPSTPSRALAVLRPDIVTFVPFTVARHTKLWNYDRDGWNLAIRSWLAGLDSSARRSHPRHPAGAGED